MSETVGAAPGLTYRPELVDEGEERALLRELEALELHEVRMRGQVARRQVRHFGLEYDYESFRVTPGEPVPGWLLAVRERCGELAGVAGDELAEVLVTRYPPGAAIGWHRDAPAFGIVAGVSLGAPCRMRFRRGTVGDWQTFAIELSPRSAYVLAGEARSAWQHSISPVRETRWSLTFRTLRRPQKTPR